MQSWRGLRSFLRMYNNCYIFRKYGPIIIRRASQNSVNIINTRVYSDSGAKKAVCITTIMGHVSIRHTEKE